MFPRPLDRVYDAYQTVIREELETPLHPATISELKWYFEHRRQAADGPVHPQTQGFLDVGAKVFGTPAFHGAVSALAEARRRRVRGALVTRDRRGSDHRTQAASSASSSRTRIVISPPW